jgi:hypothetical protein
MISFFSHRVNINMGSYITDVMAAPGTGIKQPTTKAKTGVTRCKILGEL